MILIFQNFRFDLSLHVQDCVRSYTSDWIVIRYNYRHLSSSFHIRDRCESRQTLKSVTPHQEFEVDYEETVFMTTPDEEVFRVNNVFTFHVY